MYTKSATSPSSVFEPREFSTNWRFKLWQSSFFAWSTSAALGKLINLHKHLTTKGGRLSFCNVIPQIYEVFVITKLDKFFPTEPCPPYPADDDPDSNLGGAGSPEAAQAIQWRNVTLQPPGSEEE